jgi:hypothetical protein
MAAKSGIRAAQRPRQLKRKIANLEFGIFTEPFLVHKLKRWTVNRYWTVTRYFDGIFEDIKPAINLPDDRTAPRFY